MARAVPSRTGQDRANDRGAALLIVLWGATLMSVVAAATARDAVQAASLSNASVELTAARALADAGVRLGWAAWSGGKIEGLAGRIVCRTGGQGLVIDIRPETAKADLNASSEEMLALIFQSAGADQSRARSLADAVADYRDPDQIRSPNGAEADDYASAGLSWRPRDSAFEAIEELGYLPGMDQALYARLRADVTVHSRTSEIDPELASPLLRTALENYSQSMAGAGLDAAPADNSAPPRRVSSSFTPVVGMRVIAISANGAVFVREAVVGAPPNQADAPRLLRFVQGRLGPSEALPDISAAAPC